MLSSIREVVAVGKENVCFDFCRKATRLGDVVVDHWWMRTTEVYRQRAHRGRVGGNHEALTSAYWKLCRPDGVRDEQETYLLARLLPRVRNQGSRRIVADAIVASHSKISKAGRAVGVEELDVFLRDSELRPLTPLEFSQRTADVLGPAAYSQDDWDEYFAMCKELFDPALAVLFDDEQAALARLEEAWQHLMRAVGRRSGKHREKHLLDILSYEARAALHDCYSTVWKDLLIPHLARKYSLTAPSERFLQLWHLDHASESNLGDQARFHLFHGHIFGLHPAGALFLSAPTGQQLTGAWLADGGSESAYHRLLGGLYLSVFQFDALRQKAAEDRKKRPQERGDQQELDEVSYRTRRKTVADD